MRIEGRRRRRRPWKRPMPIKHAVVVVRFRTADPKNALARAHPPYNPARQSTGKQMLTRETAPSSRAEVYTARINGKTQVVTSPRDVRMLPHTNTVAHGLAHAPAITLLSSQCHKGRVLGARPFLDAFSCRASLGLPSQAVASGSSATSGAADTYRPALP